MLPNAKDTNMLVSFALASRVNKNSVFENAMDL